MAINPNLKALWRVSSPYTAPVTLRATDWITALGSALHQLGRADRIDSMACERLSNGDLIINDLTHECRYIVQQLAGARDLPELGAVAAVQSAHAGVSAHPSPVESANEVLAMDDASEQIDPYSGWSMSLEIDQDDLLSEEQPLIERYNPANLRQDDAPEREEAFAFKDEPPAEYSTFKTAPIAVLAAPVRVNLAPVPVDPDAVPEFEDIFSFDETELDEPQDEITLIETAPRRGLAEALKQIRERRGSTP
ncbi:MAG: hypothetical protein ACI8RZ_001368 [Myxococcota bacterium]|jgi:hypothetical protein